MTWFDFSDPVFLVILAIALFVLAQQLTSVKFLEYLKTRLQVKQTRFAEEVLARDRRLIDLNTTTATEQEFHRTRQLWDISNSAEVGLAQGLAGVETQKQRDSVATALDAAKRTHLQPGVITDEQRRRLDALYDEQHRLETGNDPTKEKKLKVLQRQIEVLEEEFFGRPGKGSVPEANGKAVGSVESNTPEA